MPATGGAAGKTGDQYEALWAVDAVLRIVDGRAEHVTYESLDPEASRGVEFHLKTTSSDVEFWSIKRQTTGTTGWTLAKLVSQDENGRSILGDLVAHVERGTPNVAVFASTLGAAKFEEIRAAAATPAMLQERFARTAELKVDYDKYVLPLFNGDADRAGRFLNRLQIRTADETSLRTQIESMISLLFYTGAGGAVDAPAVRRLLAEYLLDHLHQPIDRAMVLNHLSTNGLHRMDWKVDTTVREKVAALCEEYVRPLREQLIGGELQVLPGADKLLGADSLPSARRVLVSGGAGGGKSSELAHLVERLRGSRVPTLPVRLDQIDEDVQTPQRLGETLSLPASPVAVLAGLADGGGCVLVLDQLDAVSLASGRRTEVWSLFSRILAEADGYPNLRVVVACREFDLEHDYRMRSLKAASSTFVSVPLGPFESCKLDEILAGREVHSKLRPLLAIPLHLAMFLSLSVVDSARLETRDELFAAFWTEKQRRTTRRLGRFCNFTGVVDQLAGWLSDRQELAAPVHVLDELREDADALASEHVLVLAEGRYRFFHETFFDYAFARRFARTGARLLDLLVSGEQHLFRRAQVRQVLSYLRSNDPTRHREELRNVLADDRVRFHIKRVVFQYLAAIPDPTVQEWQILRDLEGSRPEAATHVHGTVMNRPGWFDALDAAGFLTAGLLSSEAQQEERIVTLLAMPEVLKQRSVRVAALLSTHRRMDDTWKRYLRYICQTGQVFYSREMFDLFLSLIHDGTLDGVRPGFAINDDWWDSLYAIGKHEATMTSEAIGVWFDRKLATWRENAAKTSATRANDASSGLDASSPNAGTEIGVIAAIDDRSGRPTTPSLGEHLDADGDGSRVLLDAAQTPSTYVEHLLPRIANVIAAEARPCGDDLDLDSLWPFRTYGHDGYSTHDVIFKVLARALESLARSAPMEMDRLLDPYVDRPHDSIVYLVLRAWTAEPDVYAERLAKYLAADSRRLKVGYAISGVGGDAAMAGNYRSIAAVRESSSRCSPEAFAALETSILELKDEWEARHPQARGLRQFQLLSALDSGRLGVRGRARLAELRTKFPDVGHRPPTASKVRAVGSPIPAEAQQKMTDDQWLSAMARYAGVRGLRPDASGGEYELALALEDRTKADPERFIALALRMPDNAPTSYYEAILRGVAGVGGPAGTSGSSSVSLGKVVNLIARVHALPDRPCGRWMVRLVASWSKTEWPPAVLATVAWYAENDPDPAEEVWRKSARNGEQYHDGNPHAAGINSTRGAAAGAVARLLFDDHARTDALLDVIDHLAHDSSVAVRACAVESLSALLNTRADLAIPWFVQCVSLDPALLAGFEIEQFVHFGGHRDYATIRPVLRQMLSASDANVVATAARVCCLLALEGEGAGEDAQEVRSGTVAMRQAAATIYATNVGHNEVGVTCRELLRSFFADPEDSVRAEASHAFRHVATLGVREQAELLDAFLDAKPSAAALKPVIRAIEDSPVQLPDRVCRLVEAGIEAFRTDGGDIRTASATTASDLSKIVIRLYTQSESEAIKSRCLDAIDEMEQAAFLGLSDELSKIDR